MIHANCLYDKLDITVNSCEQHQNTLKKIGLYAFGY